MNEDQFLFIMNSLSGSTFEEQIQNVTLFRIESGTVMWLQNYRNKDTKKVQAEYISSKQLVKLTSTEGHIDYVPILYIEMIRIGSPDALYSTY